jgi:hypothetical protein
MIRFTLTVLGCAAVALPTLDIGAQPASLYQSTTYKGRAIGNLTGDVYFARLDDYVSAFM